MPDTHTIPLGPEALATLLAVLALLALAIWSGLLPALLPERLRSGWERLGTAQRTVAGALAAGWLVLFALALAGVILGVLRLIADPDAGGFGLAALLAAFLGAPFLIWGTAIRQTTLDYQREGHITDRIAKAVEQLGTEKTVKVVAEDGTTAERSEPNIEVRLGAILSLERIAQDSTRLDNGRDHVRVMEILCAYIRENSNARPPMDFPESSWQPLKDAATDEERADYVGKREARFGKAPFGYDGMAWQWAASMAKPRIVVQFALDVIGRRSKEQRRVEAAWPDPPTDRIEWVFDRPLVHLPEAPEGRSRSRVELDSFMQRLISWKKASEAYRGYRLDLRGANLQGADLSKGVFCGALLGRARMEGARLTGTRMEGAIFDRGGHFRGAHLYQASLFGASLRGAEMEGATFNETRMEGANLFAARMQGSVLLRARLEGADLSTVELERAVLMGVRLEGANLSEANLDAAGFFKSTMTSDGLLEALPDGQDASGVTMEWADLQKARMRGAMLVAVRIGGANLADAHIEETYFFGVSLKEAATLGAADFRSAAFRNVTLPMDALTPAQIAASFGDASVVLLGIETGGAGWPAHWSVRALDRREYAAELDKWSADPKGYAQPP